MRAYSAGSHPVGQVNRNAIAKLAREGFDVDGFSSKSWDQFTGEGAVPIDIVITVCDNAPGESCPAWNGSPVTVHWGIPDPADAEGEAVQPAFDRAFAEIEARVRDMLELSLETMGAGQRRESLQRIHDVAVSRDRSGG